MLRIGIAGIGGRMGRDVFAAARDDPGVTVAGGIVRPGTSQAIQASLGTVTPLFEDPAGLLPEIDVLVDFTTPESSISLACACANVGRPLVSGTTGLTPDQLVELRSLSSRTAIVYARNMSVGIAALLAAVSALARALDGYDVEIVEMHHRHKADAPSGTAQAIAETVAAALDRSGGDHLVFGRRGLAPREPGQIGIHSIRGGGNAGEHEVVIAGEGEELRVSHRAYSRRTFALGAMRSAHLLARQPPGFYTMSDVLGMARSGMSTGTMAQNSEKSGSISPVRSGNW